MRQGGEQREEGNYNPWLWDSEGLGHTITLLLIPVVGRVTVFITYS